MKHSIILCFSILFSGVLLSQDAGIGFRVGYDYSNASVKEIFTSSDPLSDRRQVGASGSFFIDWKVKKNFFLETHVQWAQRETIPVFERLASGAIKDSATISNVVEFPILGKFQFGSQIIKVFAFGGPNFAFTNSKFEEVRIIEMGDDGTNENVTKTELPKDSFETYDYSNLAGFGVSFKFNKVVLAADYRYKFQFRDTDQIRTKGIAKSLGSNVGIRLGYYW